MVLYIQRGPGPQILKHTVMKRVIRILAAIALMGISAQMMSAQESSQGHKSYIYCTVEFSHTNKKVDMTVDYGQYDRYLLSDGLVVTDSEGKPRTFNSSIAGLNWLGMHGWELIPYATVIDGDSRSTYYMRLDVTGLSYDEINRMLAIFSNKEYDLGEAEVKKAQQEDGRF